MRNPPKPDFKLRLEEKVAKRIAKRKHEREIMAQLLYSRRHVIFNSEEPEIVEPPKNHFWQDNGRYITGLIFGLFVLFLALSI